MGASSNYKVDNLIIKTPSDCTLNCFDPKVISLNKKNHALCENSDEYSAYNAQISYYKQMPQTKFVQHLIQVANNKLMLYQTPQPLHWVSPIKTQVVLIK